MNLERRVVHSEVRMSDETPGLFEAAVMTYDVLDDYKTIFDPGVFRASLEARLPRITWGHDWTDPIGQYVDFKDGRDKLRLVGQLDLAMIDGTNVPAVPRAHQARAQLRSKTITDFSVGFRADEDGTYEGEDGYKHFRSARLDEVALVLVGAVPGTELVSVRSIALPRSGRRVDETLVIDLGKQVAAGTLTHEEALATLNVAAGVDLSGMAPADEWHDEPETAPELDAAEDVLSDLGMTKTAGPADTRAVIPYNESGTVSTAWDGPAAMAACPNERAMLRWICAWVDSNGDPTAKASYKFPHHAPTMGSAANLNGVRNALARLPQANIPAGDRAGVEAHLRHHLADAG